MFYGVFWVSGSCTSTSFFASSTSNPINKKCLNQKKDYTERSIYKLIRPTPSGLLLTDTKFGNLTLTGNLKSGNTTILNTELDYLSGVTSSIQTQLNSKETSFTNLIAKRALQTDGASTFEVSPVTSTELGYLNGVTTSIQTQLNGKQATIDAGTNLTFDGNNLNTSDGGGSTKH